MIQQEMITRISMSLTRFTELMLVIFVAGIVIGWLIAKR